MSVNTDIHMLYNPPTRQLDKPELAEIVRACAGRMEVIHRDIIKAPVKQKGDVIVGRVTCPLTGEFATMRRANTIVVHSSKQIIGTIFALLKKAGMTCEIMPDGTLMVDSLRSQSATFPALS